MWQHGCSLLLRTENMISTIFGRNMSVFRSTYKVQQTIVVSPLLLFSRGFKGSKRNKADKERKKKTLLERHLKNIYGISSEKEFDAKAWLKTNYFTEFLAFQARLNIKFNDHKILMSAFAHPSFTEEMEIIVRDNVSADDKDMLRRFELHDHVSDVSFQKLSLLGYDATLSVVKESIYMRYPSMTPKICFDLSKFLTSRETICAIAKNLAVDDLVLLSKELDNVEDFDKEYHLKFTLEDILCDTFYSLVGAMVKDLGLDSVKKFVNDFITVLLDYEDLSKKVELDYAHGELLKILELNGVNTLTRVKTISESGVDTHFPFFHAGLYCNGSQIGEGSGHSAYTARVDAIKNTVYGCLEGEVDFEKLRQRNPKILRQ